MTILWSGRNAKNQRPLTVPALLFFHKKNKNFNTRKLIRIAAAFCERFLTGMQPPIETHCSFLHLGFLVNFLSLNPPIAQETPQRNFSINIHVKHKEEAVEEHPARQTAGDGCLELLLRLAHLPPFWQHILT